MFNPSNFIATYLSTDRVIRILDTNSNIVTTINICRYQKSGVKGNSLYISLEGDSVDFQIVFNTNTDANSALTNLVQAINTLKPNCLTNTNSGGGGSSSSVSITLLEYKTLLSANTLIPLQWYDVQDTTNLLLPSTNTFRLFCKNTNDGYPSGQILGVLVNVIVDIANNAIVNYIDPVNKVEVANGVFTGNSFSTSTDCIASNNSKIVSVGSNSIYANNGSNLNVTDCSNVSVNNSAVTLSNATNVTFDNIQQDLSSLPFNLSNVEISRDTIGNMGHTDNAVNETVQSVYDLSSYGDKVEQDFLFSSGSNTITVNIKNLITQAQGVFKIRMIGAYSGNVIKVYNSASTLLYTITEIGSYSVFTYNPISALFEFTGVMRLNVTSSKTIQFLNPTLNQVNFNLGWPVTQANECEMYLNGAKQIYGVDYSYNSTTGYMVYSNEYNNIDTKDLVEFRVY